MAETHWPGEDPLGKLIFFGNMDADLRPFTVVGVVGDVQEYGIGARPRATFYADHRQRPRTASAFHVVIHGELDVATTTASARRAANELDSQVPVAFRALDEVVAASLADRRFVLLLLALFGGVALILATMGVYAVVAYMALQRTPEIGVRIALGAGRGTVVRLLLKHGVTIALAGITLGSIGAWASTRVISAFVYDVGLVDPTIFVGTAVVLFVAVIAASWIPAHRVARIDAVEALRYQ